MGFALYVAFVRKMLETCGNSVVGEQMPPPAWREVKAAGAALAQSIGGAGDAGRRHRALVGMRRVSATIPAQSVMRNSWRHLTHAAPPPTLAYGVDPYRRYRSTDGKMCCKMPIGQQVAVFIRRSACVVLASQPPLHLLNSSRLTMHDICKSLQVLI